MSKINLSEIQINSITEGYLWFSDKPDPISNIEEVKGKLSQTNDSSNPFIAEGQLFCSEKGLSYSIKYVDGEHIVIKYNLATLGDKYDLKSFISNRIADKNTIYFRQYWKESVDGDPMCENMKVLLPDAFVFVGLKKEEI